MDVNFGVFSGTTYAFALQGCSQITTACYLSGYTYVFSLMCLVPSSVCSNNIIQLVQTAIDPNTLAVISNTLSNILYVINFLSSVLHACSIIHGLDFCKCDHNFSENSFR